jgi:hypothetical protein
MACGIDSIFEKNAIVKNSSELVFHLFQCV